MDVEKYKKKYKCFLERIKDEKGNFVDSDEIVMRYFKEKKDESFLIFLARNYPQKNLEGDFSKAGGTSVLKKLPKNDKSMKYDLHGLTPRGNKQALIRIFSSINPKRNTKIEFTFRKEDQDEYKNKMMMDINKILTYLGKTPIINENKEGIELMFENKYSGDLTKTAMVTSHINE